MKYNDKEIALVAQKVSITYEGYLNQLKPPSNKPRNEVTTFYCRLIGNLLIAYKSKEDDASFFVLLEYIDVNPYTEEEISHAFCITFKCGDSSLYLSAFSLEELAKWIHHLREAGLSSTLMNLTSARDELAKAIDNQTPELSLNSSISRESAVEDVAQYGIEIELSCSNLKLKLTSTQPNVKDGLIKSDIEESHLCIHVYLKIGIEWKRIAQTEILKYSLNPQFNKSIILFPEHLGACDTFLFRIVDYRDLKKLTFYELGHVEVPSESIKHSIQLSYEIIPADRNDPNIWHKDHREIPLNRTDPTLLNLKIKPPKTQEESLDLNSQQMQIVCENILAKQYTTLDKHKNKFVFWEFMGESKFCFELPIQYIKFLIQQANLIYTSLETLPSLEQDLEPYKRDKMLSISKSIEYYELNVSTLISCLDQNFKPSTDRLNSRFDFIPTNLHANRIGIIGSEDSVGSFYDIISVGAFTVSSQGYQRGGLLKIASLTDQVDFTKKPNERFTVEELSSYNPIAGIFLESYDRSPSNAYSQLMYGINLINDLKDDLVNIELRLAAKEQTSFIVTSLDKKMKDFLTLIEADEESAEFTKLTTSHTNLIEILKKIIGLETSTLSNNYNIRRIISVNRSNFIHQVKETSEKLATDIDIAWKYKSTYLWTFIFQRLRDCRLTLHETKFQDSSSFFNASDQSNDHKTSIYHYMNFFTRRHEAVFSQCLTAVITGLALNITKWQFGDWQQMDRIGIPLYFECLLSCYGEEASMLEDWVWAIEMLKKCTICIVPSGPKKGFTYRMQEMNRISQGANLNIPKVKQYTPEFRMLTNCNFQLSVPWPVWDTTPRDIQIKNKINLKFEPFYLNIGINEKQTFSDQIGKNGLQKWINQRGIDNLSEYYKNFKENGGSSKTITGHDITALIDRMKKAINTDKRKPVELYEYASEISIVLSALRFTSCKSAKDRTAMSVTLEQVRWLQKVQNLSENDLIPVLNLMRSTGLRLDNIHKNIKTRKYAFSSLQLQSFPKLYRPPDGTYSSMLST